MAGFKDNTKLKDRLCWARDAPKHIGNTRHFNLCISMCLWLLWMNHLNVLIMFIQPYLKSSARWAPKTMYPKMRPFWNSNSITKPALKATGKIFVRRQAAAAHKWHPQCDYCMACSRAWWRHQMETFSALLAICVGNSHVTGEFPAQRPVTRSFDVFFDLCLNKRLSKKWRGLWFETPSHSLWRHCNGNYWSKEESSARRIDTQM